MSNTIFDNPPEIASLVVHVLCAFAERSKPLSDEKFVEACKAISKSFLEMAQECRDGTLKDKP